MHDTESKTNTIPIMLLIVMLLFTLISCESREAATSRLSTELEAAISRGDLTLAKKNLAALKKMNKENNYAYYQARILLKEGKNEQAFSVLNGCSSKDCSYARDEVADYTSAKYEKIGIHVKDYETYLNDKFRTYDSQVLAYNQFCDALNVVDDAEILNKVENRGVYESQLRKRITDAFSPEYSNGEDNVIEDQTKLTIDRQSASISSKFGARSDDDASAFFQLSEMTGYKLGHRLGIKKKEFDSSPQSISQLVEQTQAYRIGEEAACTFVQRESGRYATDSSAGEIVTMLNGKKVLYIADNYVIDKYLVLYTAIIARFNDNYPDAKKIPEIVFKTRGEATGWIKHHNK